VVALALPALASSELSLVFQPVPALASLLYGGVSTVLANILYQRGMAGGVETAQVAVITSVEVAVSACIGVLLLGEPCTAGMLAGLGCVLGSIVIMNTNVGPGEAHGVRVVLTAEQLIGLYGAQTNLGGAVKSVRRHREDAL
jgi:drug/metabolite transporter (DMT)-like permease